VGQSIATGQGIFVTIEGPDGAGKSVQAATLAERLRATGRDVVLTREPGGTPLGESIRDVVLSVAGAQRDALSDALLFNAARHQLVTTVIAPALADGAFVVCDRYADSTLAYQGYGGGAPLDALEVLAAISTGGLVPRRTVLFDLPVEVGLARRRGGAASGLTRFEMSEEHDRAFHERVRTGFHELCRRDPGRWRMIDATGDSAVVAEAVWSAVADLLE
jgi:dTMP kinase